MKRYTQDYIRKVMKFKDKRIELTDKQRRFLEYAYEELRDRISYIYHTWMATRRYQTHTTPPDGELWRLNIKSNDIHNIISLNSYDFNQRTLLLKLRNYHLNRL
jgi:subtilisin-like proprotein convertase family protein